MTYLDTGCLVKLYYPEPDSPRGIALVQGQPLLEITGSPNLRLDALPRNLTP